MTPWVAMLAVVAVCRKGGTGGGGWGHPQGDLHMLAVVAVCRNALVGTGWSNSCLGSPAHGGRCGCL